MGDVRVCSKTVAPKWGDYQWPCQRASDHDGDCRPATEHAEYPLPFSQRDHDWLAKEAGLLLSQRHQMERDRAESYRRDQAESRAVRALLDYVATHGGGRSARHDKTCWLRHPMCLARELLYRPEDAGELLARATAGDNPADGAA